MISLDKLEQLEAAATPLPWTLINKTTILFGSSDHVEFRGKRSWEMDYRCWAYDKPKEFSKLEMPWVQFDPDSVNEKDAAFITEMRNSIPAILRRLRAAEALRRSLTEILCSNGTLSQYVQLTAIDRIARKAIKEYDEACNGEG